MNEYSIIHQKNKKKSLPIDVLASILVSLLLVTINMRNDLISSPDTATYRIWADLLIGHDFNLKTYYEDNHFVSSPIFYTIPIVIIAGLKVLAGNHWENLFYAINILSLVATIETFRRSARLLNISRITIAVISPSFLVAADFIIWPHYLLTDAIFSLLVMLAVHLTIRTALTGRGYYFIMIFCATLVFARPTFPPMVCAASLYMVITRLRFPIIEIRNQLLLSILAVSTFSFIYGFLFESELTKPFGSQWLTFIGSMIKEGIVVHDRPDTFMHMSRSPTMYEIARLFLLRFMMFFSPYANTFSLAHILGNCVTIFSFIASILAWLFLSLKPSHASRMGASIALSTIMLFAIFHAGTLIDFDWRYRYPTITLMLYFVAITIDCCITSFGSVTGGHSFSAKYRRKSSSVVMQSIR